MPIFFALNEKEVAEIIYHIARREQVEKKRETRIREGRKPATLSENQRYIVSGIPGVSGVLADRLLAEMETVESLFSASELESREGRRHWRGNGKENKRISRLQNTSLQLPQK